MSEETPQRPALNLEDPKDQAFARTAMTRWPKRWRAITPEKKDQWVKDLDWAREQAYANPSTITDPLAGAKVIVSIVKTGAMMEGQQQADDHVEDKNARLDAGKATENTVQRIYKAEFDGGTTL